MVAKILVCDDAKFMRDLLVDLLKEGGHQVVAETADADEAVRKYKEMRPDIVTMDLIMKKLGIEAIGSILEIDPKARIIVVSVLSEQEEQVVKAIRMGAMGMVSKPVRKEALLSEIERVLKR